MDDLISRQAAIDALRVAYWDDNIQSAKDDPCIVDAMTDWAIRQVKALPSVQPERMRAKWIATTSLQEGQITWRDYKCSNCSHHRGKPMNFCEVCGAKMLKDGEG